MPGARVFIARLRAEDIQAYPGGFAKWHADMSAKLTREGARAKSPVLGRGQPMDDRDYGQGPKNAKTGRIGGKTTGMNETERRYRDAYLVPRILTGEIAECLYEGVTLVLAWGPRREDRCTYTPDWWVKTADGGYEAHEVKGKQVWDDSRVKFKVAIGLFPGIKFVWGQWRNGKWIIKSQTRRA